MAGLNLKTTYKDDVLDTTVNTQRKFKMIQNEDGTVSFEDVTIYSQEGDSFGALDINATNEAICEVNNNLANTNTTISTLSDSVDSCFQSVSDGKALVASAITGKGVTTASDATFATMANNVGKISKGKFLTVGSGTSSGSFNVQTLCNNNGINWRGLNGNNFLVRITGVNNLEFMDNTVWTTGNARTRTYGCTPTWSYDPSNGIVSVGGCAQSVTCWLYGQGTSTTQTQTMSFTVYLIYTS